VVGISRQASRLHSPSAVAAQLQRSAAIMKRFGIIAAIILIAVTAFIAITNPMHLKQTRNQRITMESMRRCGQHILESKDTSMDKCEADAWGKRFTSVSWVESGKLHFRIASTGRDAKLDHYDLFKYGFRVTEQFDYNADIVLEDDHFIQFPMMLES
jgi:hypothetical protein